MISDGRKGESVSIRTVAFSMSSREVVPAGAFDVYSRARSHLLPSRYRRRVRSFL